MKAILLLLPAVLTLTSCSRKPFIDVRLQQPDGNTFSMVKMPLFQGFEWTGQGNGIRNGYESHHGRVTAITDAGVAFDLLVTYTPDAHSVSQSHSFHQNITLSRTAPTIVKLFDDVQFRGEITDSPAGKL